MKLYPIRTSTMAYVAEEPEEVGYVADPPPGFTEGYDGIGYVAEGPYEDVAYVAEEPEEDMAYVAEEPEEDMAYVAEEPDDDMAYADQADDEMAYAVDDEEFAAADDDFYDDGAGYYGEDPDEMEGYLPENREPAFSPRVAPVTRLEGYITPKSINPTAERLRPAEVVSRPGQWFKPPW